MTNLLFVPRARSWLLALGLVAAACTGSDSDGTIGGVEIIDPATGEVVEAELVEADAQGGTVLTEPDTAVVWPAGYLEAVGVTEEDLDEWAQRVCTNITQLPALPSSAAIPILATDWPPVTGDWTRADLAPVVLDRWCPGLVDVDQAVAAVVENTPEVGYIEPGAPAEGQPDVGDLPEITDPDLFDEAPIEEQNEN